MLTGQSLRTVFGFTVLLGGFLAACSSSDGRSGGSGGAGHAGSAGSSASAGSGGHTGVAGTGGSHSGGTGGAASGGAAGNSSGGAGGSSAGGSPGGGGNGAAGNGAAGNGAAGNGAAGNGAAGSTGGTSGGAGAGGGGIGSSGSIPAGASSAACSGAAKSPTMARDGAFEYYDAAKNLYAAYGNVDCHGTCALYVAVLDPNLDASKPVHWAVVGTNQGLCFEDPGAATTGLDFGSSGNVDVWVTYTTTDGKTVTTHIDNVEAALSS